MPITQNSAIGPYPRVLLESDSHSASQEILGLLRNPQVHHCVHSSLQLVPILSQVYPILNFSPCFPKIHSNIIFHLCLGILSGLFPSGFLTKFCTHFTTSLRTTLILTSHLHLGISCRLSSLLSSFPCCMPHILQSQPFWFNHTSSTTPYPTFRKYY